MTSDSIFSMVNNRNTIVEQNQFEQLSRDQMTISRRNTLLGAMTAGVAATGAACSKSSDGEKRRLPELSPPQVQKSLLLNQARAVSEMQKAKVDLLLTAKTENIYYLTNRQPISSLLGQDGLAFAAFAAYGAARPAMIESQIGYYFTAMEEELSNQVDLKFYSSPADPEVYGKIQNVTEIANAPAAPGFLPRIHADYEPSESEKYRFLKADRDVTELAASSEAAILKELLSNDLPNKTVAIDHPVLHRIVEKSGLDLKVVDSERMLRRIRLQKSPAELELMRYAAQSNAAAAHAAAQTVRDGASYNDLRGQYISECGARSMTPSHMLVDTLVPYYMPGEIKEGRSFLIDCVSSFQRYHGDYGRTVCVGEPTREIKAVIDTLSTAWDRLRSEIRPGLKYSDLYARSAALFKESNVDAFFAISPHSVGLHHTDEPSAVDFGPYQKDDIELVENMVLSVDMPILDTGLGGTAHLEDLVLVGKDGAELLNDSTERFIVV